MDVVDRDLQLMLIELGEDLGKTGPSGKGDDGDWGAKSKAVLSAVLSRLHDKYPWPTPLGDMMAAGQPASITDLSTLSTVHPGMLNPSNIKAFVWHHTAGGGDAKGVVKTLNQRGLNVQYIMDRNGQMYAGSKHLALAYHAGKADRQPWDTTLHGPNANMFTMGCEVIANNDSDVLDAQVKRAVAFAIELHESFPDIFHIGHGELSSKKQSSEGATIAEAIRGPDYRIKPELLAKS